MSLGNLIRNPATATAILAGFLVFLAGKLVWVQWYKSARYSAEVDRIVEKHVRIVAPRGAILDREGRMLAGNRASVNLVADARELDKIENRLAVKAIRGRAKPDTQEYADRLFEERVDRRMRLVSDLSRALEGGAAAKPKNTTTRAADLTERLARLHKDKKTGEVEGATYVPIARELTPEDEEAARQALRAHGVSAAFAFEEEFDRVYAAGASVSSILGMFGAREQKGSTRKVVRAADDPDKVGNGGIEGAYEAKLRGLNGRSSVLRAPLAPGGFLDVDDDELPVPGVDVRLTIDATLCAILHEEAIAAFQQYPCRCIAAITMDAASGDVLAMASVPGFDPNAAAGAKNHALTNYPIGFSYEPGSSIKPFTVAAALEARVLDPQDRFDVNYPAGFPIPGRAKPIRDSHLIPGVLDVRAILQHSSNIGAVKIGQKAGARVVSMAFERFGFDQKTGIGLPGEGRVSLPSRKREWDVPNTLSSVSFGYQFYVTPLRLAAGYCMLANGGLRVEPRLVESLVLPDGSRQERKGPAPLRVLGADTASTLCEMLGSVVQEDGGTAFRRAEDLKKLGFSEVASFAGKTGTAVLHKDPSRMNGTFAVFGPMPEPKVVVVFVAFDSGARFGGDQCAGPAMRALARSLRAIGLAPPSARAVSLDLHGTPAVVDASSSADASRRPSQSNKSVADATK